MVAGAILPVCIYKNKLFFLFGKENKKETSAKGWSDFGGGCEHHETPYQTAIREGIVKSEYNPELPIYFNRMHEFIEQKMPKLLDTVLFEKQEIKWFSIDEMIQRRSEFRPFYQEITDLIVQNKTKINQFIKRKRKTRKNIV